MFATIVAATVLLFVATRSEAPRAAPQATPRPIVVQGAMDVEILKLAARLEHPTVDHVRGWTFWQGTIDGYPIVVAKTQKGMENAAAATTLAAERYRPAAIINQGTSGGHDAALHVFDIVLGIETVNVGAFKTAARERGQGSDMTGWQPLDLLRADGSAGQDPNAWQIRRFRGDAGLIAAAHRVESRYARGRVVDGVIASSDMWNSELDRIQWLHDRFGTSTEEMEAASAAQIAGLYGIPFLGIRVLSNNATNGGAYDASTGEACQDFVFDAVRSYIPAARAASTP